MPDLGRKTPEKRGRISREGLAELWRRAQNEAARHHRVLTRPQLIGLGLSSNRIDRWVRAERLFRIYPGVYSVGTAALTREGRWLAAVLYAGPSALLSHLSAAVLWKLWERDPVVIDVTAARSRRSRDGIRVHRPLLQPLGAERAVKEGIPVTSAARTWLDLAGMVGERTLTDALRAGEREEVLDPVSLLAALESQRGRPGVELARRVLERHSPAAGPLRSGLESELWHLVVADPTIPNPETNVWIGGYEADMLWRAQRLIVEADGGRWHGTSVDRVRDATRDEVHRALGYIVLRFSEDDVSRRPDECLTSIRTTLAALSVPAGGARSSPR